MYKMITKSNLLQIYKPTSFMSYEFLLKLPGYHYVPLTEDEKHRNAELELMNQPIPEQDKTIRPFYVLNSQLSCLTPGLENPKTETAVWLKDGESFLCLLPIERVAELFEYPVKTPVPTEAPSSLAYS